MSPKNKKRLFIGVGLVGLVFLYLVRNILLPFILSFIVAYFLNPLITYFEARGVKRSTAILGLYSIFLLSLVIFGVFFLPSLIREVLHLIGNLPAYVNQFKETLSGVNIQVGGKDLGEVIAQKAQSYSELAMANAPGYLMNIFSLLSVFIFMPIIVFVALINSKKLTQTLIKIIPCRYVEPLLSVFSEIDQAIGNYVRGQLLDCAYVGVASTIGLYFLGIDYFLFLGLISGIGNIVPYLGPAIGGLPALLIALIKYKSMAMLIKVAALFLIIQLLDNIIVSPYVMSKSVELNPALVLFVLSAGPELMGVWGMVFAVPIVCVIKVTGEIIYLRYLKPRPEG